MFLQHHGAVAAQAAGGSAAPITLVAAGDVDPVAGATSINVTLPVGIQASDRIVLAVMARSDVTPPSGFEQLGYHRASGHTQRLYFLTKVAVGTEGGTIITVQQSIAERLGVAYAVARSASGVPAIEHMDFLRDELGSENPHELPVMRARDAGRLAISSMTCAYASVVEDTRFVAPTNWLLGSTAERAENRLGLATKELAASEGTSGEWEHEELSGTAISIHGSVTGILTLAPPNTVPNDVLPFGAYQVALVTADVAHDAATNTRDALQRFGYTVTLIGDSTITPVTDWDAYDLIVSVRTEPTQAVADALRAALDAGKPVIVGSAFTPSIGNARTSTLMNLTGTITATSASSDEQVIANDNTLITEGYTTGERVRTYTGLDWGYGITSGGAYAGTSFLSGDPDDAGGTAGLVSAVMVDAGELDLLGTPLAARCVVWLSLYGGQAEYAEHGDALLQRMVRWAMG